MSDERLVSLQVEGQIATLTLLREKQLNALNEQLLRDLDAQLDQISADPNIRVIVLQGQGRAFAAGADIAQMQPLSAVEAERFSRLGQAVFTRMEQLPQPVIGLIHGYALGGGLELAMACDIRIAAEGTKFGQPEVTLGVIPGFGGSQRLPRLVGQGVALKLLLTGDLIDAEEARRIGLVTDVVSGEALSTKGQEVAGKLAALAPLALDWVKKAVYEGAEMDQSKGLGFEASLFGLSFSTRDQKEGMQAFLERRQVAFEGK
jgi:enoyl-CoA hydratase/carnithine racemase